MSKVMITTPTFAKFSTEPVALLEKQALEILWLNEPGTGERAMIEHMDGVSAILTGLEPVTKQVIDAGKNLKVISKHGVGLDNIDVAYARERKIEVVNTPGANKDAVADYAFGLILNVARKINKGEKELRNQQWPRLAGLPVWNMTLGIIGLGNVGKGLVKRAKGFNMRIMAHSIPWEEAFSLENDLQKATLEEIYCKADYIALTLPLTEETRHMIGRKELEMMKSTAVIINTSRGGLIDEQDLFICLKEKRIAGAGIDVFEQEPPLGSPLLELDNVVITPHLAGYTEEAMTNMSIAAAKGIVDVLKRNGG